MRIVRTGILVGVDFGAADLAKYRFGGDLSAAGRADGRGRLCRLLALERFKLLLAGLNHGLERVRRQTLMLAL